MDLLDSSTARRTAGELALQKRMLHSPSWDGGAVGSAPQKQQALNASGAGSCIDGVADDAEADAGGGDIAAAAQAAVARLSDKDRTIRRAALETLPQFGSAGLTPDDVQALSNVRPPHKTTMRI